MAARAALLAVAAAAAVVWIVLAGAPAKASQAALVQAKGKSTLVVIGEKGERNRIYIEMEKGGQYFTVSDKGQVPDYSTVILRYDPASLPGCQVLNMGDETTDYLRCEKKAVQRVVLDLRDKDDLVTNGDGILRWTELNRDIQATLGGGADIFTGGPGNDKASGGPGNDILKGYRGNDTMIGGPGEDSIAGDGDYSGKPPRRGGNDLLIGGPTTDYISPGSGRDRVFAGGGNDIVGSTNDKDRDIVNCGAGRKDGLLGLNYRGIRFKEKGITGCETVGSGTFNLVWSCKKRRCVAHRS
jgi:Ca2+-binding RTX toxin-like protein